MGWKPFYVCQKNIENTSSHLFECDNLKDLNITANHSMHSKCYIVHLCRDRSISTMCLVVKILNIRTPKEYAIKNGI